MHYTMYSPAGNCVGKRSVVGWGKGSVLFSMLPALQTQAALQTWSSKERPFRLAQKYPVLWNHLPQLCWLKCMESS